MRMVKPMANAYARAAGYRQMGLKYDDLIREEDDTVQKVGSTGNECLVKIYNRQSLY